jgi:hypothetical protein
VLCVGSFAELMPLGLFFVALAHSLVLPRLILPTPWTLFLIPRGILSDSPAFCFKSTRERDPAILLLDQQKAAHSIKQRWMPNGDLGTEEKIKD